MLRWTKRILILGLPILLILLAAAFMVGRSLLLASLPQTSGTVQVHGIGGPATIARDALGVPLIQAATFEDAAYAEGFAHAQDRFFQMDGMRRFAAGRLSELIGAQTLDFDRRLRPYRFATLADEVFKRLPTKHQDWIKSYTRGVNAGLDSLGARPPEYFLLRQSPEPWVERDTLLVMYAMWDSLAMQKKLELEVGTMSEALPPALVDFLTPKRSRWDVPLIGTDESGWKHPIPGPEIVNRREAKETANPTPKVGSIEKSAAGDSYALADSPVSSEIAARGSNNFAVAGSRTAGGFALLANDMHLTLAAPSTWYRVTLRWDGPVPGSLSGVSLPGMPGIVAGTNGSVAWGFTNVENDYEDLILIETDPANPERYKTPDGSYEAFGRLSEQISSRGGAVERIEIRTTRWGVVTDHDAKNRPLVLKWTALDAEHTNLNLFDLFTETKLEKSLDIARSWYGPSQNVLMAANDGRIGWVVSGYLPRRKGFDGSRPVSWARPGTGWDGALDEKSRPFLLDPPGGILFTANARTVSLDRSGPLGTGYGSPTRSARIKELLSADRKFTEQDLLTIQLDTRNVLFDFYAELAKEAASAPGQPPEPRLEQIAKVISTWNGSADADSRALPVLKRFRTKLRAALLLPLIEPCKALDKRFDYLWFLEEEPLRRLLEERPLNFLPKKNADWPALLRECLLAAADDLEKNFDKKGLDTIWGDLNRCRVRHPMADALSAIPGVAARLSMPRSPLPGDLNTIRVAGPTFGASERFVIAPGHEESAICLLPTGQSGHPLSPNFADQFDAWLTGGSLPLLPGAATAMLKLEPAKD